jgi:NAD(P)H-hydrate repair Nnr-like enzyme with NAD(P)H-hydrate dehydratase domain
VGDVGLGQGSRHLYKYLSTHLGKCDFNTLVFHYLQPDVDWHNRILFAVEEMERRPILIADAGFMYAAKMSGQSCQYDLFTPDMGELAFMADDEAPHPFYTRGFILHEENRVPELIARAYTHNNAARCLLVKGKQDYVADRQGIWATIDHPVEDAMEAIGGTGDTLTGIVTALIGTGMEVMKAATIAARVNRLAGHYAHPTPAMQVMEIVQHIPRALSEILHIGQ